MLQKLEDAKGLLSQQKFKKAYELFDELLQLKALDLAQQKIIYEGLISCLPYVQKTKDKNRLYFEYAKILYRDNDWQGAIRYLLQIQETKNAQYSKERLGIMWLCHIKLGEIKKYKQDLDEFIRYLVEKGDAKRISELLEVARENEVETLTLDRLEFLKALMRGEEEKLESIISQYIFKKYWSKTHKNFLQVETVLKSLPRELKKSWSQKTTGKVIEAYLDMYKSKQISQPEKLKKCVKTIFEHILNSDDKIIKSSLLIFYAKSSRRSDFADFVSKEVERPSTNSVMLKLIQEIESEQMSYSDIALGNDEEVDFATDLFSFDNRTPGNLKERVLKIVREIELLKESGKNERLRTLYNDLESIDPENKVLKERTKVVDPKTSELKIFKNRSAEEVKQEIIFEISKYAHVDEENLDDQAKLSLKKAIEYLENDTFSEGQVDIVTACIELGFYDVGLYVLSDERSDLDPSSLQYKYLKTSCMIGNHQQQQALDYLDDKVINSELNTEDLMCFLYLRAECLRLLGRKNEAHNEYKKVFSINSNYRLVKVRLRESV